jgi:hypothetical protein
MIDTDLKLIIKQCFEDLCEYAHFKIKKNYAEYKKQGKLYDMVRALVFLRDVAQNPDKHFSVECTNDAWDARVEKYIQENNVIQNYIKKHPEHAVYKRITIKACSVQTPGDVVFNNIKPLMKDHNLYGFCKEVKNFYYKDIYKKTFVDVKFIRKYAGQMHSLANMAKQKNPVIRGIQQMFYNYEK